MTPEPPTLTDAQKTQLEQRQAGRPLPHARPLPVGTTAVQRPDSVADPRTETTAQTAPTNPQPDAPSPPYAPMSMQPSLLAPETFTLFRNTDFGATIKANTSGLTGEPTVANSGAIVFATGNWWAAISGNGGQTFSYLNPYTMFPASFGGFCCDQVTVYDPSRDIFIWSLQYVASGPAGMGQNLFRIAVARPSEALKGNWFFYDFPSAVNTEWDYPDLCLSNDFVYYFTNRGVYNSGSVNNSKVFRFPLDPMSTGASFSYNSLDFGGAGITNLSWRCARGARDIVYFAAHNTTSQVRIFRWAENSPSLSWDLVNLSAAWPNGVRSCPTPDGRDWCGFDDGRMKAGWVSRNMIGFMWNASAGGGFPVPYVEAVRVVESTRALLDRPLIWNSAQAWQYPAAAPNERGDLGIVAHLSASDIYPSILVLIDDDYSRDAGNAPPPWDFKVARYGTQGPNTNRWGDYFAVQPYLPAGLGWIAVGTTMQGCGVAGCKETRFEIFGRARDLNGIPLFGTANRDFNGDGKSDILWRHTSGSLYQWQMDGTSVIGTGSPGGAGTDWTVVGAGDFDGDGGKADILWRHSTTGQVYVWLMNGVTLQSLGSPGTVPDLGWQIVGVGDFNGDGKADILWRHSTTGQVYVWLMNGMSLLTPGTPATVPDLGWQIVGVGDFDGDGKADILWRHSTTGQVYLWLMNGVTLQSLGSPGTVPDLGWQIVGVGDFNGDGKADILWRHTSGVVYEWLLDGTSQIGAGSPGGAGTDWTIVGVGDFNGDGRADILWRHTSGAVYTWLLYGTTVIGNGSPGSAATSWVIQ